MKKSESHSGHDTSAPGSAPTGGQPRSAAAARAGDNADAEAGGHDSSAMVRDMRRSWLWTNWTVVLLGLWLLASPVSFGYRQVSMRWSDWASGGLLVVLGLWSLRPTPRADFFGRWGAAVVGTWLQAAPLVFWADAAAYANDTLVGAIVITLTILVPMMPGMAHHMEAMKPGPEVPPGWSYNPSSWHQRAPIIALAAAGWFLSRALAAVQLGYVDAAWEPFFGEGTQRVLHSDVSRAWPVSDAGLGAFAYTLEVLMGFMGGKARWRTMPWMVTFFGILVVPLGVTHVVLVILQPVMVGHWCTLCLAAATVMLIMIPLTLDEVWAMLQFMVHARREGKPLWRTFWVGGTIPGGGPDERTPAYGAPARAMVPPAFWGVTATWGLVAATALGVWLMFAPAVFGATGRAADSDRLAGALVVTIAVIAMAEVARSLRFAVTLLGLWVVASPWIVDGATPAGAWNDWFVGLAIAVVSLRRGSIRERYGGWRGTEIGA